MIFNIHKTGDLICNPLRKILYSVLLILTGFVTSITCFSQEAGSESVQEKKNFCYVTGGTLAFVFDVDINYERQLFTFNKGTINARISYGGFVNYGDANLEFKAAWVYLFGKNSKNLELNLGFWVLHDGKLSVSNSMNNTRYFAKNDFYPLVNLGYRYYKPGKPYMFRFGGGVDLIYGSFGVVF